MLLPLAWLVRVDDTPEHRKWLKLIATDLLESQQEFGGIQERLGPAGLCNYCPPSTNVMYATSENGLIQQNGDPCSDMLYTHNFALV